jgi:hypothetical protein
LYGAGIFSISTARSSALVASGAEKQRDEAAVELFDARSAPRIDDVKRADWGRRKEEWKNIQWLGDGRGLIYYGTR